jgi:hypothetical protein
LDTLAALARAPAATFAFNDATGDGLEERAQTCGGRRSTAAGSFNTIKPELEIA